MKLMKLAIVSFIVTFSLLDSMAAVSSQGEVRDEREFNYEEGGVIGPENWGNIHEDWAICGYGKMQSPIDLSYRQVSLLPELGPLQQFYRPARAVLLNRGHDIMLEWKEDAGFMWINGTTYNLKQVHWHSPTEHRINGKRYALEAHMVHMSADNKIAVVGILYAYGRRDPFLAKLEKYINELRHLDGEEEVGIVDPDHVNDRGGEEYYRYMGSLTTPPCTEGVVWTVMRKVRTVSRNQVWLLRDVVHDGFEMNARPIQKTNGRTIDLYCPGRDFY